MNNLLVDAISNIDNDIIEQYFKTKQELKTKRKKPNITLSFKRWIAIAACFAVIFVSTLVIIRNNMINQGKAPPSTNSSFLPNTNITDSINGEEWNGLKVSSALYESLLNGNDEDSFDIVATVSISIPSDYLYNGKKYSEYLKELKEAKDFLSKAKYLVDEGDLLKYGELLYTDGTPNGVKWTKTKYDKVIDYYGESILNTYIVDGEFLKEKLLNDTESTKNKINLLNLTLDEAKNHIRNEALEKSVSDFEKAGQNATIEDGEIQMTITKKDFSCLFVENSEKYSFSLYSEK